MLGYVRAGRIQRPSLPPPRPLRRRRRHLFVVTVGRQRQYGYPSADSVDNSWTDQAGGTSLFAAIDETLTPSDADYIQSPITPVNSGCRVKVISLVDPASSIQHQIHWRAGKRHLTGPQVNMTVTLRQGGGDSLGGGTEIASFTRNNVGDFATYIEELNTTQADSITDYTDLYLEFYANQV